ncbi:MAG: FecR family protein [Treponema sp.]|nr:FecR family protein [Treponema sp.]
MKKVFLFGIAILTCVSLFAFDAEVIGLEGKAQVSKNGTTWTPLAVGSKVSQGDTIQTGFKSQVKLKVKGSEITLDSMTRIKVDQLSEKGDMDNTVVSMKIGSLTSNVKKIEDRRAGFTVKGPAATASVRGTVLSEECGYNRDIVTAIESTTMVWPSSLNEEIEAEAPEMIAEGGKENEGGKDGKGGKTPAPDNAPPVTGARAITPGQVSSVDNRGGERSPQSHAAEKAFGMGGATAMAAHVESVAPGGQGAMTQVGPEQGPSRGDPVSETATATTGSIVISVTLSN